jgi:hypothetical protein
MIKSKLCKVIIKRKLFSINVLFISEQSEREGEQAYKKINFEKLKIL